MVFRDFEIPKGLSKKTCKKSQSEEGAQGDGSGKGKGESKRVYAHKKLRGREIENKRLLFDSRFERDAQIEKDKKRGPSTLLSSGYHCLVDNRIQSDQPHAFHPNDVDKR